MKTHNINLTKSLIAIICVLTLSACGSDEAVDNQARLTDMDLSNAESSIFLNNECLSDATVEFVELADTDSVTMILYGVNPREAIEMTVATARDGDGNIEFNAKRPDDLCTLVVDGICRPGETVDGKWLKPSVKVNIKYTVPIWNVFRGHYVSFDGNQGFRHIRDYGTYPFAKDDIEGQRDSCEYICRVINTELAKSLDYLYLELGENGDFIMRYATPDQIEHEHTFRYWVRKERVSQKRIIDVENPKLFYASLLDAMGLSGSGYVPESTTASLYMENYGYIDSTRIMILDDLHYKIFGYINNSFAEKGIWEEYNRRYITLMYMGAEHAYTGIDNLVAFNMFRWCFSSQGIDE